MEGEEGTHLGSKVRQAELLDALGGELSIDEQSVPALLIHTSDPSHGDP